MRYGLVGAGKIGKLRARAIRQVTGASLAAVFDPHVHSTEDIAPRTGARVCASLDEAHGAVSDLRYEVMYFLEARDETIPAFKDVWAGIGDSIVVVGGDGLWNCHIHTDDIGAAVEAALDCGRPRNIRVTDLAEQVEEERWVREAPPEEPAPPTEPVPTAVVAVATGDGLRRIFHSLGVHHMVAGGQSMNPSTREIATAVEAIRADAVLVLPNNPNVIHACEQVNQVTNKRVEVIPSTTIPQGVAALLALNQEATIDENIEAMKAALAHEDAFSILNVHLRPDDVSPALKRLASKISKKL